MRNQQEQLLEELKSTRDFLFELYDRSERDELKVALRLVNREIKRIGADQAKEEQASNNGKPWTEKEDKFLNEKLGKPTSSKDEAKRLLIECAEQLKRTDAETYSRIRALGLNANLHAWGNKPKSKWQTIKRSANEPDLPGTLHEAYQGFKSGNEK